MEPSSKTNAKQGYSAGRPGSDKLAELERRYVRKESPSPESADAVRVVVSTEAGSFSLRPKKLRRYLPWLITALSIFGMTGSGIVAWIATANEVRGEIKALKQANAQLRTELDDVRDITTSQARRIKSLEGAPGAPLVVTK